MTDEITEELNQISEKFKNITQQKERLNEFIEKLQNTIEQVENKNKKLNQTLFKINRKLKSTLRLISREKSLNRYSQENLLNLINIARTMITETRQITIDNYKRI